MRRSGWPALLAAAVLLAGCSSGPDDDVAASPATASPTDEPDDDVTGAETVLEPCPEPEPDAGRVTAAEALPPLRFDCIGGGAVDLGLAPGVPTVLNLWGSWCPPCREELPFVQQLADAGGDRLQVLGLVSQDTVSAADSFAADAGVSFPNAFDQQADLSDALGIRNAPYTFFLAADGTLVHTQVGPVASLAEFEQLVGEHLGVTL